MLILAINTASSKTAIALFKKEKHIVKIIAEDSWAAENREAEKLMPAIHNLLGSPPDTLNYSDIGEIYVIKGPGSFTGLRVGITVANTLAYLLGCKLYGITTFEYWHTAQPYPVLIYAGSGGVYFSSPPSAGLANKSFAKQNTISSSVRRTGASPSLLQLSETEQILKSKKIKTVCGDIAIQQKQYLKQCSKPVKFISCKKTFGEIMKKIIESQTLKPVKIIKPVYIKPPGITKSKKCST